MMVSSISTEAAPLSVEGNPIMESIEGKTWINWIKIKTMNEGAADITLMGGGLKESFSVPLGADGERQVQQALEVLGSRKGLLNLSVHSKGMKQPKVLRWK